MSPSASAASATILDLPPEIRRDIFITLFQSIFLGARNVGETRDGTREPNLGVLSVCRQFYREASPLAIPNLHLLCGSNADVIETLSQMSHAQIAQLRFLTVMFVPVGLNVFQGVKATREEDDPDEEHGSGDDDDDDDRSVNLGDHIPSYVRYFHLGAILSLFPGLQLDFLEVQYGGELYDPCVADQFADCLGSLLEADGYRRLYMFSKEGMDSWYENSLPSMRRWRDAFETRFKPYGGRGRIPIEGKAWRERDADPFWVGLQSAGITLVDAEELEDEYEDDYDTPYESLAHLNDDGAGVILERGPTADIAVKADDGRVLRCIELQDPEQTPESYFEEASNALKKLFKEKSWESIKAMDGFDNGFRDDGYDSYGQMIYMHR